MLTSRPGSCPMGVLETYRWYLIDSSANIPDVGEPVANYVGGGGRQTGDRAETAVNRFEPRKCSEDRT